MNDIIIAFIQGVVEGLTEFLPVSSTGHLILTGHLLGFTGSRAETFEIVIQLGAILAIVVLYWRRLFRLLGWKDICAAEQTANPHANLQSAGKGLRLTHFAVAALPGVAAGFLFHDFIKSFMWGPYTVLAGLVLGGLFMIYAERKPVVVRAKTIEDLTHRQAFRIGLAQCLSIIMPGFSRSGATISGGLLAGASLRASADFSFLLAVPMMLAASGYDVYKNAHHLQISDLPLFITGFAVSFLVAMLAVVSFLKLLEKVRLSAFAYYRFALAGVYLLYLTLIGLDGPVH